MAKPIYPRRKGGSRVRVLTNSPDRGNENWTGMKLVTTRAKRQITRLMKRDPADGRSQPFADKITSTPGTDSGAANARVLGRKESRTKTSPGGAGQKRIGTGQGGSAPAAPLKKR